jgi:hypothetical protein
MEYQTFLRAIRLESVGAKADGHEVDDENINLFSATALWRSDDSLLSPDDWDQICQHPQLMAALRSCMIDTEGHTNTMTEDNDRRLRNFSRYSIGLLSLQDSAAGSSDQAPTYHTGRATNNLWLRFQRNCRRHPNQRVSRLSCDCLVAWRVGTLGAYIYIYIYVRVCVCIIVCVLCLHFIPLLRRFVCSVSVLH